MIQFPTVFNGFPDCAEIGIRKPLKTAQESHRSGTVPLVKTRGLNRNHSDEKRERREFHELPRIKKAFWGLQKLELGFRHLVKQAELILYGMHSVKFAIISAIRVFIPVLTPFRPNNFESS